MGGADQLLADSVVYNGDDCATAITSDTWTPAGAPAVEGGYGGDVLIRNVTCNHSHGVSIGSVKHGIIRNVTVANVSLANGLNGVRIKAYPNGSGAIYDIHYRDVAIHNVRNPIIVDGFYCPPTQRPYPCHSLRHSAALRAHCSS